MAVDRAPRQWQVVFLLDVDNTLIDNDQVRQRLDDAITRIVGPEGAQTY